MTTETFKKTIRDYYRKEGRHDMPWRKTRDPYRILISEIMLQQTQVARVKKFYLDFIKKFPNFRVLANARTAEVLRMWQGLGYNRRALSLQKLSRIVLEKYNAKLPRDRESLEALPGIGKATAGSLRAFAFNEPDVFIETNIRRIFIYFFFPGKMKVTDEAIKRYIQSTLPKKNVREWYWALMDYGAMLGAKRRRDGNPNRYSAHYKKQQQFKGSDRELRGKIVRLLLKDKQLSLTAIVKRTGEPITRIKKIASGLVREGFMKRNRAVISV
jgi:A/G-specific adenine glycosylase